jgi:bile acid:Na+ symporter, BASS family
MTEALMIVVRTALVVFLLASMLEMGLRLTVGQVWASMRNPRLVIGALVANFVIAPLLAIGIARALRLEPPFALGLLLLGLAPGAPIIPKVVQMARGNVAFAVVLMALLMVGTVIGLPLLLPGVAEGAEVSAWKIAQPLLLLMLLPLVVGMIVRARVPALPAWVCSSLGSLSDVCGLLVVVLIVALNFKNVLGVFGTGAILAGLLFALLTTLSGWLLGGADRATRATLGLGTGLRNVAAALVIGAQNFNDPRVNVMVIVSALASFLILLPAAHLLGRRIVADAVVATPTAPEIVRGIKRPGSE